MNAKKGFLTATLVFLCCSYAAFSDGSAESGLFSLKLFQDGREITLIDNVFSIGPRPFYFQFSMDTGKSIYLNFSESATLYESARDGGDIRAILGFGGTGMAESMEGKDTYIVITETGWHVWYYDDGNNSRFSDVSILGDRIIARRLVNEIILPRGSLPIEDIARLDLYVVFCDVGYAGNFEYNLVDSDYFRIRIRKNQ